MDITTITEQYSQMALGYAPKILGALVTLIIGFWIINRIVRWANKLIKNHDFDPSLSNFLASLINVGLKIMLLLTVAGMFGVATTSFIAIFSALAFAIGMALQGNLGHLASGVMLMIFKPFKVGDRVDLNGQVGTVEGINAFNTTLLTLDNKKIFVPNGTITQHPIINISGQDTLGVNMTFGIGYDDDIDLARSVIQDVVKTCPHVIEVEKTLIKVSALGDSSVNFVVRPWCKSEHYWDVWFYMHEGIKKAFDRNNIGIPYPQMDVHVKNS